ncbi:putative transposase [Propionivibrio sp.]|uniref:putative transposase n=1 Tax=Propionivibrio sp. TaxID=2212460 RepID=UPI003BF0F416
MQQLHLPMFPQGVTQITNSLGFTREKDQITYFHGSLPVFTHALDDLASFRMITSQFFVSGHAKQSQIARAFGIPLVTIKRAVKRYREGGPRAFYVERKTRGAAVLTEPVLAEAQRLLDDGLSVKDVAARLELKSDTLDKAVRSGRVHVVKKKDPDAWISSKSERTTLDAAAPMGVAAHDIVGRLAASVGALGAAAPRFEAALDVPNGGVLCALPALLAMGLLEGTERFFTLPAGYYAPDSLLMLLAFMALCRMQSIEVLRNCAPGEWGKLLGLDRAPEVRTLRKKIHLMSAVGHPLEWSAALCQRWMEGAPEQAHVLYIDGHVRVYHGQQTRLPKHYVAREKLCLRATVDYWVNAMDGQPFMVINQVVDPGLIRSIEEEILPRLEVRHPALAKPASEALEASEVPEAHEAPEANEMPENAPEALEVPEANEMPENAPGLHPRHRLVLVFDREGYSPDFFQRLLEKGIACLSYHKYPGADWAEDEFQSQAVTLVNNQVISMRLAERGTRLPNGLWLREIRKLTDRGHQTAILSTDYHTTSVILGARMFARWSQENFFRYGRLNFGLDRLADYSTEEITDPIKLVNPAYRQLDSQVRSANARLSRLLAQFGALNLELTIDPEQVVPFVAEKSALHEQIEGLKADVVKLKADRKETAHYIKIQELPEADRFKKLGTLSKHFLDTIKIVAYRAESAMANIVRETLPKPDQARALLCALYTVEADLLPDYDAKTLTVRLHHSARSHTDAVITKLCDELSATETLFPRTDLRMIFKLGSS